MIKMGGELRMYYSITFGAGNNTRNTWTDWHLMPQSPPVIASPKPKTNYVDIPGRYKGPLDLTKVPFNRQLYERITGNWVFVMRDDYWHPADRADTSEQVRSWLHGRVTVMKLEEDPSHYFNGRFTVTPSASGLGPFNIQIDSDLEPVRYNLDGSPDTTWTSDVSEWIETEAETIIAITDPEIHALFGN